MGITWWSIGRYGISLVQTSFFSFFGGGGVVPLNSQIYTEICSTFVIFWNDNSSDKLYSNVGETKFSQTTKYAVLKDDNIISVSSLLHFP